MGKFSEDLVIKEVGYKQWEVMEEFFYSTDDGYEIVVNKGFRCDLASVARWFKSVVDTPSYWTQAAVVHDKLYDNNRTVWKSKGWLTRKKADQILIEAMKTKEIQYNVPWRIKRKTLVYWAVRLGGMASWKPGFINRNNQET